MCIVKKTTNKNYLLDKTRLIIIAINRHINAIIMNAHVSKNEEFDASLDEFEFTVEFVLVDEVEFVLVDEAVFELVDDAVFELVDDAVFELVVDAVFELVVDVEFD